ncbi:MAG: 50S ribosomal protein L25 [Treponema sp.]|nr:50S ribosomal protein L25 [Treponema sp.]
MEQMTLSAKARTTSGKKAAKATRAAGRIPAVVYGSDGKASMIDVDSVEFNKVWRSITATTLVTLDVDGTKHDVFIKDTEYNIRTDEVLHADFYEPAADKEIVVKMKVHFTGTAAGVLKGGFMLKHVPEVTLKAVAKKVPVRVEVDVSALNVGDKLTVGDMKLADGVKILTPAETPLVSISPAR